MTSPSGFPCVCGGWQSRCKMGRLFLPDISSPVDEATGEHKGQILSSDLDVEKVIGLLDGDLFSDAAEYYDAEQVIMKLTGFMKPSAKEPLKDAGESDATE